MRRGDIGGIVPNRSKINDPRFQKLWRDSGAVGVPFSYEGSSVPAGYRCSIPSCRATGCKLWRSASQGSLLCVACAGKIESCDTSEMDQAGTMPSYQNGRALGRTYFIGYFSPAVPKLEGNGQYWTMHQASDEATGWWQRLPTRRVARATAAV
jgi:hypothetical protein